MLAFELIIINITLQKALEDEEMHDLRELAFQDGIFSCFASESVSSEELLHRGNVFESVIVLGLREEPKRCMFHSILSEREEELLPIQYDWNSELRVLKLHVPSYIDTRTFSISLDWRWKDGCWATGEFVRLRAWSDSLLGFYFDLHIVTQRCDWNAGVKG